MTGARHTHSAIDDEIASTAARHASFGRATAAEFSRRVALGMETASLVRQLDANALRGFAIAIGRVLAR